MLKAREESAFIQFARDDLHSAAAGRVASHHFIEKVWDMTKNVAPSTAMSIADIVTYAIVGCLGLALVVAFIVLR